MIGVIVYLLFAAIPWLAILAQGGIMLILRQQNGAWHAPRLLALHAAMIAVQVLCIAVTNDMEDYVFFLVFGTLASGTSLIVQIVSFAQLMVALKEGRVPTGIKRSSQ